MFKPVTISVITPSFNQAEFIERTIESVLSQKGDFDLQYIVMDGGSTDGTLEILKKYDGRIYWFSGEDAGQSDAVNKGIGRSTGEIIGWLNSDDIYLPGTLQKVTARFREDPGCQWLYGLCSMIGDDDRVIRTRITAYKDRQCRNFSYRNLLTENFISQPAVFFRKELFTRVGPLELNQHYAMDFDLWIRMARVADPVFLNDCLASFRMHGNSKSMSNTRKMFYEQYKVHKKYDQGWGLLLKHRIKITGILTVYKLMDFYRALRSLRSLREKRKKGQRG